MKISIIGAGNVGATAAYVMAMQGLADEISLIDIAADTARGKALDIKHAMPIFGRQTQIVGGGDHSLLDDADVVIITAGSPRRPGDTRESMLEANAAVVRSVIAHVKERVADVILVMVTNPLDAMTWLALRESGFKRERVLGMAGTLDSARFRAHLGSTEGMVVGSHNDAMVPLFSQVKEQVPEEEQARIIAETRQAGGQVAALLRSSSAYFATGAAIAQLATAIIRDTKEVLPASAYLEGEYNLSDICIGVPCRLGRSGIESIEVVKMNDKEQTSFLEGAAGIRKLIEQL